MRSKKCHLLLALLLTLALLTGCTAAPPSSTPSSDMPTSTPPSSSEPSGSVPSSSPEYPIVQLKGPAGMPTMTTTLTDFGYIEKNGVLHYSPTYKSAHGNAVTTKYNKYIVADGTAGAKSLAADGYTGLYVLMQNGTVRLSKTTGMDDKSDITAQNYTNVGALQSWGGGNAEAMPNTIAALTYDASGKATLLTHTDKNFGCKVTDIVQVVGADTHLPIFLYADGTVGLYIAKSESRPTNRDRVGQWTDMVQITLNGNLLMGLQKDGTLLCEPVYSGTSADANIPAEFRTHICRIFQTDNDVCVQRSDGTVYSLRYGKLGTFPLMDQIYCFDVYMGYNILLGVDASGKVHSLSHKETDVPVGSAAAWALTHTDVKTVWND